MNTLSSLKQETFSTSAPSMCRGPPPLPGCFLKSTIISLLLQTSSKVVALAPCCQVPDLLSVGGLIIVGDETQDGVGAVCVYTVMRDQGVQEGTENAALRASGAQGQYRGAGTADSHHLGSASLRD